MIPSDNAIHESEQDSLGRDPLARSFANQILALDATEGVSVGVLGAWGAGKTSFINLARAHLPEDVTVLDFNPWMFSGAEQLVEAFFVELAAQMKLDPRFANLGGQLLDYGEAFSGLAWLPVVGPWVERGWFAARTLGKLLARRKEGIGKRRKDLIESLKALDDPIVVVLDDIDRLTKFEIRDVFKLVRLTASFPNVIYIVAFDRYRVEEALTEQGLSGRDYLEKILQVAVDLPKIPDGLLQRQITSALDSTFSLVPVLGPFDENVWTDVFIKIIRPLIGNIRDLRRYVAAVHGTLIDLEGQIAVADVLALEAIRVFLPDAFQRLRSSVNALTMTSSRSVDGHDQLRSQIEDLIEAGGDGTSAVKGMIEQLFPAAVRHIGGMNYGPEWESDWLTARRVAHRDFLQLYLEKQVGSSLGGFLVAEKALEHMADRTALDSFFRGLDSDQLETVISSLVILKERFVPEHVVPGTVVLLNLLSEIDERPRGILDPSASLLVRKVVYRLLKSLDAGQVVGRVRLILSEVSTLSAKLVLTLMVGHRENIGHGLVSEEAGLELERVWRDEVRAASSEDLARENDLLQVLLLAKRGAQPPEEPLDVEFSPDLTVAILRSAVSEVTSQTVGSYAVRRSPRLAWDQVVELFGDEEVLAEQIRLIDEADSVQSDEAVSLARKYLEGWRPGEADLA